MQYEIEPDDLVLKLVSAINAANIDWNNSTLWTRKVKAALRDILQRGPTEVIFSEPERDVSEFMLDIIAWSRDDGEGIVLAVGGKHRKPRERETKAGHEISAATTTTSSTSKSITKRRARPLRAPERNRIKVIGGAIRRGLKGQKYCHVLDVDGLPIRKEWIDLNCPKTYSTAYGDPKWRKRIQDEKHRVQVILDRMAGPIAKEF